MASPPKPWERASATPASSANPVLDASATAISPAPAIPQRPSTLSTTVNQNAAAYSMPYGTGYGNGYASGYGNGYSPSPYSSPYSRLGGYGGGYSSGMYGGYGGYATGGMYGSSMYGGGTPGMVGNPNDPNSLTNRFGQSTATTFQMLEGIVGAFGGFAQMLESTYMATHSSFFAMVSVAEQFSNLRDILGQILGIFAIMRWLRTIVAKLTGRPLPADAVSLTPSSFARFEGRTSATGEAGAAKPRASRKPLIFFLLAAFGLPYLMGKMIRSLARTREEEEGRRLAAEGSLANVDPSQLEFCRLMYDYAPEAANSGADLQVRKGDLVAVLSRLDPFGNAIDWWKCRTRDGRVGYLPSSFLETIKPVQKPVAALKATTSETASSRANSLTSTVEPPESVPTTVRSGAADLLQRPFYS